MDNSTPEMSETLVRLLDGELSGQEKTSVENQLATDALLQQEFDSLLATRAAVRHLGLQQQVNAIHSQMMDEFNEPARKISPVRKMLRYSTAIAAGIVVLIAAFFAYQYFSLSPEKVFSANYQAYELSTVRGTNETTAIEGAYRNKNYTEVIRLHANTPDPTIKNDFLAGAAALELNNLPQAKLSFNQVIDRNKKENTRILKDEAEYYLALTLVRQKEFKAALLLLESMQNDPDHIYRAKINDGLLRDVRKLSRR